MRSLLVIIFTLLLTFVHSNPHRRFLHQPFFPVDSLPPPFTQPPLNSPPPAHPKYPFSTPTTKPNFFPLYPSPPPPPLPPSTLPTFPANISSLILPQSSSKPISRKLVAIAVSLSLLSATLIAGFLLYHRRHHPKPPSATDSLRLFPPNTTPSDKHPPTPPLLRNPSSTSSEFLYLGTLFNSKELDQNNLRASKSVNVGAPSVSGYQKLGSPELHPLPPLARNNFRPNYRKPDDDDDDDEEFFSPRGSSGRLFEAENQNSNMVTTSYQRSNSASPTLSLSSSPSLPLNSSPRSFRSRSTARNAPSPSPPEIITQNPRQRFPVRLPPPPPPLPPARFWETSPAINSVEMENPNESLEISKPKLKPLHWDKVKASSDRAMVWDHLKSSSSFQLNEEMIETLFMVNSTNLNAAKNYNPHFVMPLMNQDNRVLLDPKKSQNISILLRAVDLTVDEVCEALLEGNIDTMGTELLESLLKMVPTKEEEHKLKECKDEEESPFKLGPAEKFLKALLDIPFAFKRIEAMLYIANFDSEVEYLQSSFQTLEAACEELRNNRMFMKLLEAVLKTGNRMNVGTNRGDAHAFKLDTLLKLVDIKGTDGKTTLLHFVVEEIVRSEGSRLSGTDRNLATGENPVSTFQEEKKLGLQVVSGLSGELTNVKKAATMDYDVLISEVAKLAIGMAKVGEVVNLNEELALKASSSLKFSESMKGFLKIAEQEIMKIQAQEGLALRKVKETTEYFHGNSIKEEAHPFRIFMVVRDFLSVLDKVCKEFGRMNERTMPSSTRQFPPMLGNPSVPPVFQVFNVMARHNSPFDDDESLSSA